MTTNWLQRTHDALGTYLVLDPEMSLREFRDYLGKMLSCRAHATCQHCGTEIVQHEDEQWYHDDPDHSRGCRAASYRSGAGWNDALAKNLYARPRAAQ